MSKFKKGISGNPAGRPAGQTPGAKIRAAIEQRADDILQSVIDAAVLDGDMHAAKMLLDRITPPLKPAAAAISIPAGDTLTETGTRLIAAALAGQIPPDIGSQLITALAAQGRLIELQEMAERLQRIEQQLERRT